MAAALITCNRLADRNRSAQPVDNSGEKLGATAGQWGTCGGEDADNRPGDRDCAQQAPAGSVLLTSAVSTQCGASLG
jgi:hypothetical protein